MLAEYAEHKVQVEHKIASIVIVGIGNDYRKDDAAGLVAARELRKLVPDEVRVIECIGGSFEMIDSWEGAETVILVDAVSSSAGPGMIYRIEAHKRPIPSSLFHYSTHGFSVSETIELAKLLGKLPPTLLLFGIEGADFGQGEGLSEDVAEAVERVTHSVLSCIRGCIEQSKKEK